ncbi:class I SAM-dependent methyltransferase [Emticicia agri]|uniref:Class I SAM-dependent methyltransferase n=1 Tax=Emticicia agri TaxID=2492393 RepID=A0A4Q5M2A8_9BACT|nr:class I SAM-dependent methyltransferase [Emticicia agri]RYU96149.1 class I SAM-dependent methyltransferase [Emticicia agri]
MDIQDAIQLISHPHFTTKNKNVWLDLGCGTGTFTLALANILEAGSTIHAVDFNSSALEKIPDTYKGISITKQTADFIKSDLSVTKFDGILMANSLHYVKEKEIFLNKLKSYLADTACFLVIEYDSNASNSWVPYPIDFQSLNRLFSDSGYKTITKLHTRPSIYGKRQIYAALIQS